MLRNDLADNLEIGGADSSLDRLNVLFDTRAIIDIRAVELRAVMLTRRVQSQRCSALRDGSVAKIGGSQR
jgi:hypothetical protein